MTLINSIRNIAIVADPLSAGVITSIMATRLEGGDCNFDVVVTDEGALPSNIYARPNIRHIHQLLEIKEQSLARFTGGRMAMALPMTSHDGGRFMAPLGHYGWAKDGCGFQHYWLRAFKAGLVENLEYYNFALRLNQAGLALERAPMDCPMIEPGYEFDRKKYGQYLFNLALISGKVRVIERLANTDYDIIIHVSNNREDVPNGWIENHIYIHPDTRVRGLFLYQLQSAMTRLFELWPKKSRMDLEAREYNRRLAAESVHITDMKHLCQIGPSGDISEKLERKIDLFQAKGRIAFEDYDVFSTQEWTAALRASGVKALGYDSLAGRMNIDDIIAWFKKLDAAMSIQIQRMSRRDGL